MFVKIFAGYVCGVPEYLMVDAKNAVTFSKIRFTANVKEYRRLLPINNPSEDGGGNLKRFCLIFSRFPVWSRAPFWGAM